MTRVNDQAEMRGIGRALVAWFQADQHYVVALSGGVDSAVVAKAASLSTAKVTAATACSPSLASRELADAERLATSIGLPHVCVHTQELQDANYQRNDARRCYYCKSQLFHALRQKFAKAHNC